MADDRQTCCGGRDRRRRPADDAFLLLGGIRRGEDPYDIVGTMELRDDER
ncbi:hypothetical protein [Halosimplex halobium]